MRFHYPEGATPLDPNESQGLIPKYISLQSELNEHEQENIVACHVWLGKQKNPDSLDVNFLRALHKRMFDKVWRWAGEYRKGEKSIGVPALEIGIEMRKLVDDVQYWIDEKQMSPEEIAVRFHHRLVVIHPFPNGNGRFSRLAANVLGKKLQARPLTFAQSSVDLREGEIRKAYISALKAADLGNYAALIAFALS